MTTLINTGIAILALNIATYEANVPEGATELRVYLENATGLFQSGDELGTLTVFNPDGSMAGAVTLNAGGRGPVPRTGLALGNPPAGVYVCRFEFTVAVIGNINITTVP